MRSPHIRRYPRRIVIVVGMLALGSLQTLASAPISSHPPAIIGGVPGRGKTLPAPLGVIGKTRVSISRIPVPNTNILTTSIHGSLKQGMPGTSFSSPSGSGRQHPASASTVPIKNGNSGLGQSFAAQAATSQNRAVAPPSSTSLSVGASIPPNTQVQGQAQSTGNASSSATLSSGSPKGSVSTNSTGGGH